MDEYWARAGCEILFALALVFFLLEKSVPAWPTQEGKDMAGETNPLLDRMRKLHEKADWVFGVLVGLAIREALVDMLPQLAPSWFSHQAGRGVTPQLALEFWRLLLFLLMILRFYLGSVVFFGDARQPRAPDVPQGARAQAVNSGPAR